MKTREKAGALQLADYVEMIIAEVQRQYPQAICLMNGDVYGDQDVNIDIYVPEEDILEVERYAHEVTLDLTQGTDWFILPSVATLESCPLKPA